MGMGTGGLDSGVDAPRWICRGYTSRFLGGAFSDTYFTLYMGWILMYNVLRIGSPVD